MSYLFLLPPIADNIRFESAKATALFSLSVNLSTDNASNDEPIFGNGEVILKSRTGRTFTQTIKMPNLVVFRKALVKSIGAKDRSISPYGITYSFVFQDFDFDGAQDLAICKNLDGSYGAPSYAVFRWNRQKGRFISDAMLTRLSSEHLGLICTTPAKRTIETFDKSGAAWHKTSSYKWKNGALQLMREEIEDATGTVEVTTTRTKVGSKWIVRVTRRPKRQ